MYQDIWLCTNHNCTETGTASSFLCEMGFSATKILACTWSPFLVIFDNIPHLLCYVRQSLSSRSWSYGTSLSLFLVNVVPGNTFYNHAVKLMHELPWIATFWSRMRWFANDFHEWRSHDWKSLANHITSSQPIVIHGNECIVLSFTHYSWTQNSAKNHRPFISPLSPRKDFSELTQSINDVTT